MAEPTMLPGNRFRFYRSAGGSPETFNFVCIASTLEFMQGAEFEDVTVPDCATPTAIPNRKSLIRSRQWSISFSGATDALKFKDLQADYNAEDPHRYQIRVDRTLAEGGGTYTGALFLENLTLTTTDRGMVRFSASARGEGGVVWADAAA